MDKKIVEELKRLKEKMDEIGTPGELKQRIEDIQKKLKVLEPEIAKAEIIKGGTEPSEGGKSLQAERQSLENEKKELECRLPYLDEIRRELQDQYNKLDRELLNEIIQEDFSEYEKLVQALARKWREAETAERNLVMFQETSYMKYSQAGGKLFRQVYPSPPRPLSAGQIIAMTSNPNDPSGAVPVIVSNADLAIENFQNWGINLPKDVRFDREKRFKQAQTTK